MVQPAQSPEPDRSPGPARSSEPARPSDVPADHVVVLFGATGDLARRKLLPGLFHLARAGLMPRRYRIVGSAPAAEALTDQEFRTHAQQAVAEFGRSRPEGPAWEAFAAGLSFGAADTGAAEP